MIKLSICTWLIRIYLLSFMIAFVSILNTNAKDFGVVGHTYEIIEQDVVEYIKQKLSSIDLNTLNREMQEKVKASIENPQAVQGVTDARETHEYDYDPTFTLGEPIIDHEGRVIYTKGTTVNPLEKVTLSNALIFINGDNKAQVDYAIKEYKSLEGKAKIILTKGSPLKLQKDKKIKSKNIWIYFDQSGIITSKLGIKHVPAIVTQEGLRLKIKEEKL